MLRNIAEERRSHLKYFKKILINESFYKSMNFETADVQTTVPLSVVFVVTFNWRNRRYINISQYFSLAFQSSRLYYDTVS